MKLVKTVTKHYRKWEFYKHDNGLYTVRYYEFTPDKGWTSPYKDEDLNCFMTKTVCEKEFGVKL